MTNPILALEQIAAALPEPGPHIFVAPDGWEISSQELQPVIHSIMRETLSVLTRDAFIGLPKLIMVQPCEGPPMAYMLNRANLKMVGLSARQRRWAQFTYQLSHEIGHVCCNHEKAPFFKNPFQWLEEAICGALSLSGLVRMRLAWSGDDSPPHWRSYAPSFHSYYNERCAEYGRLEDRNWGKWYDNNKMKLQEARELLPFVMPFARDLHEFFEARPGAWDCARYLNLWGITESRELRDHLEAWMERCPVGAARAAVVEIAEMFGFATLSE